MSVIQNIRERYAKWAGGIIAVALVGFVLQDAFSGNSSFRKLFGGDPNSIAKVNGHDIDRIDFDRQVQDYQSLSELFRKGQPMTEEEQAGLRQQVLDQVVMENLMKKDADKLGISVGEAEKRELIYGQDPDPAVKQFFTTIYGGQQQFSPQMIKDFEKEAPKQAANPQIDQQQRTQIEKLLHQWDAMKGYVVTSHLLQKYNALVSGGVYTPRNIFDRSMQDAKTMAGVRFVKIPYTAINDNDPAVKVTDADINTYVEKHRPLFEVDQPTRNMDYVVFDIKPDAEDTMRALGALQKLKGDFATATDNEDFVSRNTEERFSNAFVNKKTFKSSMTDTIFNSPVGTVIGPFYEKGGYQMVKVVASRQMADSARAQHILIAVKDNVTDTMAHKLADSLMTAIKGGANFDQLAMKYSADSGSRIKGGDLGYFPQGQMVPQFNDSVFYGAKGELKEVKTQFGWHIIRITDQKAFAPSLKLATIAKTLNTGDAAYRAVNAKANEFAGKYQTAAAFDAAVKKEGLNKRVASDLKATDYVIPGLGAARDVIRWAWDAKEGEVSSVLPVGNDKVVVAKLASIQPAGLRQITPQIRPQLEAIVRAQKKAAVIMSKYKGNNLDAIAQSAGQPVQMADSLSGNSSNLQKLGAEPRVAGYIFNPTFAVNSVSPAIQGRDGVFYLQLVHRDAPPATTTAAAGMDPMAMQQRTMEDMQMRQGVGAAVIQALRKKGTVVYHAKNI